MSFLRNFFGTSAVPAKDEKKPIRALPASWYTSQDMYELERRSIFSRKWLLTTHKHRVPNTGDCVRYDAAGYEFIVAKDNNGDITAFNSYYVKTKAGHIQHYGAPRPDQIAKGFRIATTYFWPNASFNIS